MTTVRSIEVEEQAARKLESFSRDLEGLKALTDLFNADENTKQDYAGRFVFELLQNGADAYLKAWRADASRFPLGKGKVSFVLTDRCLLVANTGSPFSFEVTPGEPLSSLESISRLGESTKESGVYMGNKGIGFRAIYQVCSRLWLVSGPCDHPYQIRYDGDWTKTQLIELLQARRSAEGGAADAGQCIRYLVDEKRRVPMLRVGHWFDVADLESFDPNAALALQDLRDQGFDTVLVLEQKAQGTEGEDWKSRFAWKRLAELSATEVLFLDTLCEVCAEDRCGDGGAITIEREVDVAESRGTCLRQEVVVKRQPGAPEGTRFLVYRLPTPGLKHHRSAIAFALDQQRQPQPIDPKDRVFYTFYPAARENHGFPFYVHSYFQLSPNREYFNTASQEAEAHNRALLDHMAGQVANLVLPDLRESYPDCFLPEVLLPMFDPQHATILAELAAQETAGPDLAREGRLATWFALRVIRTLADQPLVRDLTDTYRPLHALRWAHDGLLAEAADRLFGAVAGAGAGALAGALDQNVRLTRVLSGLGSCATLFETGAIDLDTVTQAALALEAPAFSDPAVGKALLVLLDRLSGTDGTALTGAAKRLRTAQARVLLCVGDPPSVEPLPPQPEQGRALRATAAAPLVFYPDRELEEDSESLADGGATDPNRWPTIPHFCHVHRLDDRVLTAPPTEFTPDRLRPLLHDGLGLRPFRPEEIAVRIGESILADRQRAAALSDHEHRSLLLGLVERRRFRRAVQSADLTVRPWFERGRDDSDWRLFHYLAKGWIPVAGKWVPGDAVILAGRLGDGDALRDVYDGTEQVFLSEGNEAPWLREWLDDYYRRHRSAGMDDDDERSARFRAFIYRLLGAWPMLRFEIVQRQAEGGRYPKIAPDENPHRSTVTDAEWKDYVDSVKSPFQTIPVSDCGLVQSAAIPFLSDFKTSPPHRDALVGALWKSLGVLQRFRKVEVLTARSTRGHLPSLLAEQLRRFNWVTDDRDAPADSTIWYTRQDIPTKTHPLRSAHYVRSVTGQQMEPALAQALGIPILEDAAPEHAADYVRLYETLCLRLGAGAPPGAGFLTLYRQVVTRLQQIWLKTDNPSESDLAAARTDHADPVGSIRASGVIVLRRNGEAGEKIELRLVKDVRSVYYDDTGADNRIFFDRLPFAAFDDTSQGLARLLELRLLGSAQVRYTDGRDECFAGFEFEEGEVKRRLDELRAPLFAFRAYASFVPEQLRLKVGEKRFRERWEEYGKIKVEILPDLWITVDDDALTRVPERFGVVLEHKPGDNGRRRLFVRQSLLPSQGNLPERLMPRLLARPIAALIGAEAQTIAVEMLLERYVQGELDQYLEQQCEILPEHVRDVEHFDQDLMDRLQREITDMEQSVLRALHSINRFPTDEQRARLREIIECRRSTSSRDLRSFLQRDLNVPVHDIAQNLGFVPLDENSVGFRSLRSALEALVLVGLADHLNVVSVSDSASELSAREHWERLVTEYRQLPLPSEIAHQLEPSQAELARPIVSWARAQGLDAAVLSDDPDPAKLPAVDHQRYDALFPSAEQHQARAELAATTANRLLPWAIALARRSSHLPIGDLVESLNASGLRDSIEGSESLDGILEVFCAFLSQQSVAATAIDAFRQAWPGEPKVEAIGLPISDLDRTRVDLEFLKTRHKERSVEHVAAYRGHLEALRARDSLATKPKSIDFKPQQEVATVEPSATRDESSADQVAAPSAAPDEDGCRSPRAVRRHGVTEDEYVYADLAKRVTGDCGEEFALFVQRDRWEDLCQRVPDLARARIEDLASAYDLDQDDTGDTREISAALGWLRSTTPQEWFSNGDGWEHLVRLLHMARWSSKAGYDVLGLDRNRDEDEWTLHRIEVKATSTVQRLDFPISSGELRAAGEEGPGYVIWRVLGVQQGREPSFFRLPEPIHLIKEGKLISMAEVTILKPNVA